MQHAEMVRIVALIALVIAIALDVITLGLALRRNVRGRGASGVPIVPWFLYLAWVLLLPQDAAVKLAAMVGLTAFHLCCQGVLPMLHQKWLSYGDHQSGG